ncbi:unnamed protein product [Ceratitis capitata]|uniref:(Mediterranean fruit fly) hypothetical protein n=1 Tax=Ceratitis capitata TaxID=7213 RepID=A0A811UX02_CERCA|nr:unnamed protein product [Ceratitis capitata]
MICACLCLCVCISVRINVKKSKFFPCNKSNKRTKLSSAERLMQEKFYKKIFKQIHNNNNYTTTSIATNFCVQREFSANCVRKKEFHENFVNAFFLLQVHTYLHMYIYVYCTQSA